MTTPEDYITINKHPDGRRMTRSEAIAAGKLKPTPPPETEYQRKRREREERNARSLAMQESWARRAYSAAKRYAAELAKKLRGR